MKSKIYLVKRKNPFKFKGDFYLPILILSIVFFVAGLALFIFTNVVDFAPSTMAWTIWIGMALMSVSTVFFVFMCWGPESSTSVLWKIISLLITWGLLTAMYFIFRKILFDTYTRYDGDQETIHIAILSCIIAAAMISIIFMFFRKLDVSEKHYIIAMIVSLAIALITMVVGNFVRLFWAAIIEFLANVGSLIVFTWLIGFMNPHYEGGYYGGDVEEKYETSDGHTLTSQGGGYYKDENGNSWKSDDGGHTAYME